MMSSAGFPSKVLLGIEGWEYSASKNTIFIPKDAQDNVLSQAIYMHEKGHAFLLQNKESLPLPIHRSIEYCSSRKLMSRFGDGVVELLPDIMILVAGDKKVISAIMEYRLSQDGRSRRPFSVKGIQIADLYLSKNKSGTPVERVEKALLHICSTIASVSGYEKELSLLTKRLREHYFSLTGDFIVESVFDNEKRPNILFGKKIPISYFMSYGSCLQQKLASRYYKSENSCSLPLNDFEAAFCSVLSFHVSRDVTKEETGDFAISVAPKTKDGRLIAASAISNSVPLVLFNSMEEFSDAVESVCSTKIKDREKLPRELEAPEWASKVPDYGGFVSRPGF